MRYYCNVCGLSINDPQGIDPKHMRSCIRCDSSFVTFPDYETPAQYETRTGKKYPNNGVVWFKCTKECCHKVCKRCYIGPIWQAGSWQNIKDLLKDSTLNNCNGIIVVADPPVPPPNNWRPE